MPCPAEHIHGTGTSHSTDNQTALAPATEPVIKRLPDWHESTSTGYQQQGIIACMRMHVMLTHLTGDCRSKHTCIQVHDVPGAALGAAPQHATVRVRPQKPTS